MPIQSRLQWLRLAGLATGALALLLTTAELTAQTQTRQVPVESFVFDLKSPDPVRRQAAVKELGGVKYTAAIPDLIALTHDPVDAVRRELEFTLERMADIQTLPGFIALASDNLDDVRGRAVASLVNIHLPRETGVGAALTKLGELMPFTPDRDLEVIVELDVPVDPSVVETLRTRLGDTERGIRKTAIRGLGILRAKPGIPDLLQVAREDRDDSMRFEAVRSIRKIADVSIADQLVALLNVNSDGVRNEIITTLGTMRFRGAVAELTRIVEQAPKTDTPRILALSALADIADPASMPVFDLLKNDKSEAMRLYSNEGIARTADKSRKTDISAARLVEKSPRVRTAQAFALSRIGESEYLDELVRALERTTTKSLAREYLLETRPVDRQALFAPRTAKTNLRAELADILGLMGDKDALPRLQELARDSNEEVAKAAERATRRLVTTTSSNQER